MISIIAYIIHYYILPEKVYEGLYCLEEFAYDQMVWCYRFRACNVLDVAISIGLILALILEVTGLFDKFVKTSSESES